MPDRRVQLHQDLLLIPRGITTSRRAALALLLILGGCATPEYRAIRSGDGDLPVRAGVADVPFYPQEEQYCGPASLAMALNRAGIAVTQTELAGQVFTPGLEGSLATDVRAAAHRHGALAVRLDSLRDLLAELAAGRPVLVFQNLGLALIPQWHFAVAVGYDLEEGVIRLHSGSTPGRQTPLGTFERTWRRTGRWAVTVTPPGQLPATAVEASALDSASGLERAGRYRAAAKAYRAIAERWPASVTARIGLGNALYAAGDIPASARAFRSATELDPDNAPAWNNRAHVLAELGRWEESLQAAQRAVAIGGGQAAVYRQTLESIRGRAPPD